MSKPVIPIILSDDGNRHEPIHDGEVLDVSILPISDNRQNLLETDDTGILLTGEMLVSGLENNPIINNVDGKLYLRVRQMISPEDKVLKVADNLVLADLSLRFDTETSKIALLGKDGTVISEFVLPVSPGLPTVVEILQDFTPPKPDGYEENPYKESTYLHMQFLMANGETKDIYIDVMKLVDVYTGGYGIVVENNRISVAIKDGSALYFADCCDSPDCKCGGKLDVSLPALTEQITDPADKIITVQDGKIGTELRLAFDSDKNIITLLGKDDAVLGEVVLPDMELPEIPGLPVDAEFVDTPPGVAPGKYLHLTFQLADGTTKDLYINVTELVDVYTGGEGVTVSDKVISVKLAEEQDNPLVFNEYDALAVNRARLVSKMPDNALSVSEVDGKLYVKGGLDKSDIGVGLTVDEDGKLVVDIDALAELLEGKIAAGISSDPDNALKLGSDGKAFFPGDLGKL